MQPETKDRDHVLLDLEQTIDARITRTRNARQWRVFLMQTAGVMLSVFLLLTQVIGIVIIRGDSMNPTLYDGDIALIWRCGRSYAAGDIVLFETAAADVALLKRVVATGADTVELVSGSVIVNNVICYEPYLYGEGTYPVNEMAYPLTVSEGHYFVLGDNRGDALDSRTQAVGEIPAEEIHGKIIFLFRASGKSPT